GRRLPDTLREAEVAAGSRAVSQTGRELREAGSDRDKDERYRVRAENGRGKGQTAATVQDGIPVPAGSLKPMEIRPTETPTENGGNDGAVESREIQEQDSPLFPPPLGNPATAAGFPHSHRSGGGSPWPKHQTQKDRLPDGSPKPTRKEKSVAEPPLSRSSLQDHSVLETIPGFRIILRLENARVRAGCSCTSCVLPLGLRRQTVPVAIVPRIHLLHEQLRVIPAHVVDGKIGSFRTAPVG